MVGKILRGIWSFIFWSYERGTWQYDLMCALILAFIFLTPHGTFTDCPRPAPGQVVAVSGTNGPAYRIDATVLAGSVRSLQLSARQVLEEVTGRRIKIRQMRPILDAQGHVAAYEVVTEAP